MGVLSTIYTVALDFVLTILNLFSPKLKRGSVVPRGSPGEGGKWPEYIPPKEGDSRSPCPALNTMANHGILPRNGKNITFVEVSHAVRKTFNRSASLCRSVPGDLADLLHRPYSTGTFDLAEASLHNGIEHDASLTREDTALVPNQAPPSIPLCQGVLDSATGRDRDGGSLLTIDDLARYSGKRRTEARQTNKDFTLDLKHKLFASASSATFLVVFGGRVDDLRSWLLEERLPDGWEPCERSRFGQTWLSFFFKTVLRLELKTKEGAQNKSAPTGAPSAQQSADAVGPRADNQLT